MPTIDIRTNREDDECVKLKFDDSGDYLFFDTDEEVVKFFSSENNEDFTLFSFDDRESFRFQDFVKALEYLYDKNV